MPIILLPLIPSALRAQNPPAVGELIIIFRIRNRYFATLEKITSHSPVLDTFILLSRACSNVGVRSACIVVEALCCWSEVVFCCF